MLKSFSKFFFRNLIRHKFYSLLNICGLAVGLCSSMLIGLYVLDEYSYDKFHKDPGNIYSIGLHINYGGQESIMALSCPPLAEAMITTIPGVESVTRVKPWRDLSVRYNGLAFTEDKVLFADSNFFKFFNFKLIEGNTDQVLSEPNSIVLTKNSAIKYFGNEPAVGKIVNVGNNRQAFKVTGVCEDTSEKTEIQFEMLASAVSDRVMRQGAWGDIMIYTWYRKSPQADLAEFDQKLRQIVLEHVAPELEEGFGVSFAQFEKQGGIHQFFSYPLTSSHLYHPEIEYTLSPVSDVKYIYILEAIGVFILLIAAINFMNLTTARSANRGKEVGLKKTLGSVRSHLIAQFLTESFFYVLLATLIAVIAIYVLLPSFNLLSGKELRFVDLLSPTSILSLIAVVIMLSLLAGSYPAVYLTGFNPIDTLKGHLRLGVSGQGIRSVLVIFQFSISICLIICTLIIFQQIGFMRAKDIGLDKQNVISLKHTSLLKSNQAAFMTEVTGLSSVEKASYSSNVFPDVNQGGAFRPFGTTRDLIFLCYYADYDHLESLHLKLKEGRFFQRDFLTDSATCVINEAAAKELGWNTPVNEQLTSYMGASPVNLKVIGVVKNFNFESLRSSVKPLVILFSRNSDNLIIRYKGAPADMISSIETIWKKYAQGEPFEYSFLDRGFDRFFREEQRLGGLFSIISAIAVFVACLGLIGLASYTAEQRLKEIGIRKVMGATVGGINLMLSRSFMILVGISFLLGGVAAFLVMNKWLGSFAYRINQGFEVYLTAGLIAAAIAFISISLHFIRAARSNPVKVLKYE